MLNPCWIWAMFLYCLNGKWMNMEAFDPASKLAQGLIGIICWLTTTAISTILRRYLKFDTPFHPLLTHGETMLNHHFPLWNGLKLWVYQPCSDQPKSFKCISNYDPIFRSHSSPILSPSKGVIQENIYTACRPPSSMVQPVRPQPRMMDSNPEVSCCVRRGFLLPWSAPNHPKLDQLSIETHDFWDAPILGKLLITIPLTQDDKIYINVRTRDRNKRKQTIHLWSPSITYIHCINKQ